MTIKDFLETINYRITEGSEYCWRCYGETAHTLEYWSGISDGESASIIFDTETQVVYETTVNDYGSENSYRWIHSDYAEANKLECKQRGLRFNEAYDNINFIDLELEEDFLEKARAIINHEEYDIRVSIPLELSDNEVFTLMKLAHERDITLNQFIVELLEEVLNNEGHSVFANSEQNSVDDWELA